MPLQFPFKISLANLPTPLRLLPRISKALGGPNIWLKNDDMTGSALSGNKIRKLEYILGEALADGVDTLITCGGTQSNHCRATALVGAQLGLNVHLVLRQDGVAGMEEGIEDGQAVYDGNMLLDKLAGARVSVYEKKRYGRELNALLKEWQHYYQDKGHKCRIIPTGASDGTGLWGYISAAQELEEDFSRSGIRPGAVVCATGSGGTQGGLTLGFHLMKSKTPVVGIAVCDSAEYFKAKVLADISEWAERYLSYLTSANTDLDQECLNITTIDSYIGQGYSQVYPEMLQTIKWLASEEGVVLDPVYTGKAFHGLVSEIKSGRFSECDDIVFVHTGGIFGVFPFRQAFSFNGNNP